MARAKKDSDKAYRDTLSDIKQGIIDSVYVLFGTEIYLQEHVLVTLQRALIDERTQEMDYHLLDVAGKPSALDFSALQDELRTPVFFSKRRMLVLRHSKLFSQEGQAYQEQTLALLETAGGLKDVCLVFQEEKVDGRYKKLDSSVKEAGRLVEIDKQSEDSLRHWLSGYLHRYKIRITREASDSLLLRTDARMTPLMDELKKLRLYAQGAGAGEIDLQTVEALCAPDLEGDIFRLTDALTEQRGDEAWAIFENLKQKREPLALILIMITRHYKQLLVAHELKDPEAIREQLRCPPFVARKLQGQTRRYTLSNLLRYYVICAETDWAIKSGQMPEDLALDLLLGQLSMR